MNKGFAKIKATMNVLCEVVLKIGVFWGTD